MGAPAILTHVRAPSRRTRRILREVDADGRVHEARLTGRDSVFAGPTDVAYAARDCAVTVTAGEAPVRVAVCGAKATNATQATTAAHATDAAHGTQPAPFRHVTAAEVPVELRGAGRASREVRNMGLPDVLDADDESTASEVVG